MQKLTLKHKEKPKKNKKYERICVKEMKKAIHSTQAISKADCLNNQNRLFNLW
jgi:hypothetical protein